MILLSDAWQFLYNSLFTGTWIAGLVLAALRLLGRSNTLIDGTPWVRSVNLLLFLGGLTYSVYLVTFGVILMSLETRMDGHVFSMFCAQLKWTSMLELAVFVLVPLTAGLRRIRNWQLVTLLWTGCWAINLAADLIERGPPFRVFSSGWLHYLGRLSVYGLLLSFALLWFKRNRRYECTTRISGSL